MTIERWVCKLQAKTNVEDGSQRKLNFNFDGLGDLEGKALKALKWRIRKPRIWLGVECTITTPLGQRMSFVIEEDTVTKELVLHK